MEWQFPWDRAPNDDRYASGAILVDIPVDAASVECDSQLYQSLRKSLFLEDCSLTTRLYDVAPIVFGFVHSSMAFCGKDEMGKGPVDRGIFE